MRILPHLPYKNKWLITNQNGTGGVDEIATGLGIGVETVDGGENELSLQRVPLLNILRILGHLHRLILPDNTRSAARRIQKNPVEALPLNLKSFVQLPWRTDIHKVDEYERNSINRVFDIFSTLTNSRASILVMTTLLTPIRWQFPMTAIHRGSWIINTVIGRQK